MLKVYSDDFYQTFTLYGLFKSEIIPSVYGLLVGKNSTDYERFFQCIVEEDNFNPELILFDFGAATIKAINSLFTNVSHKGNKTTFFKIILYLSLDRFFSGCLFHFGQCIWHQIQSLGLRKKYLEDKSFHLNVKILSALAFVPVSDVIKGFDVVADEFADDAEDLLGYFEKTWIEEPKKRGKLLIHQSFFNILF